MAAGAAWGLARGRLQRWPLLQRLALQRCGASSQGLLAALVSHAAMVQAALRG
jgi:hypothetical protein